MIEDDHARLALWPILKFADPPETVEDLLPIGRNYELMFDFARFESSSYKEDVIRVVFAQEDPAAM